MVALLPCRGSVREREVPCPINIAGLAKLYNAVTQYRIDHEAGNFAQYLQDPSKKVCKPAQPEWSGWQAYHQKHAARSRRLNEVGERVIPVKEGSEMMSINPPLITMRKGHLDGTINCALTVSTGLGVGLSFIQRYENANQVYDQSNVRKLSAAQVNNFQNLLYLNIQYLASCCNEWKTVGPDSETNGASGGGGSEVISAGGGGGSGSHGASPISLSILREGAPSSATDIGGNSTGGIADDTSGGGAAREGEESGSGAESGGGAGGTAAAEHGGEESGGEGDRLEQSEEIQVQLCEITSWDHRSGEFPLNDNGLRLMAFPEFPKPKYYYAAALILFLRASRTELEEKVFQHLCKMWTDWFNEDLTYKALEKGPPRKGPQMYTAEEINWCEVRLDVLDKMITASEDRVRLGLPPLKRRGHGHTTTSRDQERRDLADSASAATAAPAGAVPTRAVPAEAAPAAAARTGRPATAGAVEARAGSVRAAAAPALVAPAAAARTGRPATAAHAGDVPTRAVPAEPAPAKSTGARASGSRKRKAAHSDAEGAAGEVESSGGTPTKEGGSPGHGAGVLKAGRVVSANNGRPLVRGVGLRKTFPNNYRSPQNTNLWRGHKLNLGEAFKLACFVHYGPRMPYDQSGDFETRKALFRTAAYYAMSPANEQECMTSHEFADFLNILVATAKQMRYNIMTEARIFFGDKVFTTHRASQAFQSEYFASATHDTQYT